MPRQSLIIILLLSFVSGIFIGSFVDLGMAFVLFLFFIAAVFISLFSFKKSKALLFLAMIFFPMGLGFLRYETGDRGDNLFLKERIGQRIILGGVVAGEPEEKENYNRFVFDHEGTKILVYSLKYPEFRYGDEIEISGLLKEPEKFSPASSGGNETSGFDWPAYLAKDGIYYEMFYPKIDFVSSSGGSKIKKNLFGAKEKFLSAISKAVPSPNSEFLGGITIGARKDLPKDIQDDFKKAGVAHIVALSGYNIAIVAESIMLALAFLPRYFSVGGGTAGIILFAVMTGASSTVMRASVMALISLGAKATGRIYTASWALFVAGFFMIFQNPKILRFDLSFQLSFLATLGLICLSSSAQNKLKFIPEKFKLREIFSATVSAQIFVLPLLVYKTGMVSLVSLLANFMILPFIPITMFFGFLTGISGMISYSLSLPFGWIAYALSQYELWIIGVFAKLPLAFVSVPKFSWVFLILIYAFIGVILLKLDRRFDRTDSSQYGC